jgi:DNA segregation ATPase FtsK/SpoIIIE, S-DNA-T family
MRTTNVYPGAVAGGMRGARSAELVALHPRPSLGLVLIRNLFRLLGLLLVGMARHPVTTTACTLAFTTWLAAGAVGVAVFAASVATALMLWRRLRPDSYRRLVVSRWRGAVIYRRRWQPAMVNCGLAVQAEDREYLPKIRRVVVDEFADRLLVDLLSGQCPDDFEAQTSQLAHTFEALRCRVRVDRPGRIWLDFTQADPLTTTIPALDPEEPVNLRALPVGRQEDGQSWRVRLHASHLLVAGATDSGESSLLWSLLGAMGPAIRDGSVQVWAIDPKGGMELTPGAGLFHRFAYESPAAMVELLEDAVAVMRDHAERLRQAGQRMHTPTPADPMLVLLVDEMATLTAYCGDRDLKRRAESALQLLLSQGRAPGVVVVAAVQDPGKDVIGFRDLFPTRIALRLLEDVQVDMVLGRSARLHGAHCDLIPPSLPGVGYVVLDGIREPIRVRSAHVSDDDVAHLVDTYTPGHDNSAPVAAITETRSA